jgi:outer membrane protein assembly factor BamB
MRTVRALSAGLAAAAVLCATGCSADWPMFRHNILRTGQQLNDSPLKTPASAATLAVRWTFNEPNGGIFRASPVLANGRIFIGSSAGRFYAIDANTGTLIWTYPAPPAQALTSTFTCNPSSEGIAHGAAVAKIGGVEAVIFGAPDRSLGTTLGESRLFAINTVTGAEIWKSPVIGRLTNTGTIFHEQIGYSAPLVLNDSVYVGVGDHCDNPIQKGRVVKVLLATGAVDPAFSYCSTGTCLDTTRGGGVWSPNAGLGDGVFITTGNTRTSSPEPSPNRGLSLLRLNPSTGAVSWQFAPVPWALDADPDWAAPPTVVFGSCGTLVASTQKDGWTHTLRADTGARLWSYPPPPAGIPFTTTDGTAHGDTRYSKGVANWGDVLITQNGGYDLITTHSATAGYGRLSAFNACASPATPANLLRWMLDVPGAVPDAYGYTMSSPTVTGGLVYVGTSSGHLLVIADPSVSPGVGFRCVNPAISNGSCVVAGYFLVQQPAILKDITLTGSMTRSEPIIAGGRVYVSTDAGKVYMLSP